MVCHTCQIFGLNPSKSSRERITALAVQHAGGKDILAWDSLIVVTIHGKSLSMDWFKGKFTGLSPIFNGKIDGFL